MLCSYVYEYLTDTLSGEQLRKEDLLYLQIGAECSKCYMYDAFFHVSWPEMQQVCHRVIRSFEELL